jgi:acyl carrier protein
VPAGDGEEAALLRAIGEIVAEETGARHVPRLTRAARAAQVPGWDSLIHGRIVLALEARLGLNIDIARTYEFNDLGGLVDYLRSLGSGRDG